jgi:hypothetical protein
LVTVDNGAIDHGAIKRVGAANDNVLSQEVNVFDIGPLGYDDFIAVLRGVDCLLYGRVIIGNIDNVRNCA